MALIFVRQGGSNTSPYDTWAKAATSLQTALSATADGDVVVIQHDDIPTADKEISAATTYTVNASKVVLVSATRNDTNVSFTPNAMGTSNWIGNSTTGRTLTFATKTDASLLVHGVTFRVSSSTGASIRIGASVGQTVRMKDCRFMMRDTGAHSVGFGTVNDSTEMKLENCVFDFSAAGQLISISAKTVFIKCSTTGTSNTVLFNSASVGEFIGCDFSSATNTIVPNTGGPVYYYFERCAFASGATLFAAQTSNPTIAAAQAWFFDCTIGTTRRTAHFNALGSTVVNTGTYVTSGAAGVSWEVTTTANPSIMTPYQTPWIDWHNTGTSAITPYIECLRNNGTATAYSDAQVWAEFSYKNTSSSPLASGLANDEQAEADLFAGTAGTAQAAGVGTGSWTISGSNSPASFKCGLGSSVTPTEAGALRGLIAVAQPSITIFVDPQIRT